MGAAQIHLHTNRTTKILIVMEGKMAVEEEVERGPAIRAIHKEAREETAKILAVGMCNK